MDMHRILTIFTLKNMDMDMGEHHDHPWNMEKAQNIYSSWTFGWSPTLIPIQLDPA
jgi:hypothetical protein